jgi:WD40 repeat protein
MSVRVRAELVRVGLVVAVVAILLTTPLFGIESVATITEDLFVSDKANGEIYVFRTRWKGKRAATTDMRGVISAGLVSPTDVAVGGDVVVVLARSKNLRIFDSTSLASLGSVKIGKDSRSVAITPDGKTAFVAQGRKNLRVVDIDSQKVIKKAKTGKLPWEIRLDDRGKLGAVVNVGNNSVSIFEVDVLTGDARSAAPGVTTIKAGVCNLSGGIDIARFPPFGTFALWSCGDSPSAAPHPTQRSAADPPAQSLDISDPRFDPTDFTIPGTKAMNSAFYNPLCPGVGRASSDGGSDDGTNGDEEEQETDSRRIGGAARHAFNYNFFTATKTILGPGQMVNHFTVVDGNMITVYHPQGVNVGKSKTIAAPANAEIIAVESTMKGIPGVCSR